MIYKCGKEVNMTTIDTPNTEAKALFNKLDFKQATELSNKAYKLAQKQKYPKGKAEVLLMKGLLFWVQQKYLQAREMYLQSLKIIVTINDLELLNIVYSRLGMIYGQFHLVEESLYYLSKALEVSKAMKDDTIIAGDNTNLAIALVKTKNYP